MQMATLTRNLFRGQGERDHRLRVVEGHWPTDVAGAVFVVGPDKREPDGHWFAEHGLLQKVDLVPDRDGRIVVRHRIVATPVQRIKRRLGFLFRRLQFMELSPFGVTNLANTNVQAMEGRLFVGYDAGRPVEVDPETLEFVTFVGGNDEWLQAAPGVLEPLCAVAAHPASDHDEGAMYFVNYTQIAAPGAPKETWVARWGLDGPVRRWRIEAMSPFDSIHDIKSTEHHLVFTDLPFVVEPDAFRGRPRTIPAQDVTHLWIVAKADLRSTPPGQPVPVVEVELPMPTGHLSVQVDDSDGVLTVNLEHAPLADLVMTLGPDVHDRHGNAFPADYQGLVPLGVQPGVVGRYRIAAASGEVLDAEVAWDDRFWGAILATRDESTEAARERIDDLWYVGCGFDADLLPADWWRLYGDGTLPDGSPRHCLVPPDQLPEEGRPGAIAHFDLRSMKVDEVWTFEGGAFPSPPTFVPRTEQSGPGDGYLVVLVHCDGQKELQVFDAHDLGRGPLARATAPGFNPPLLLHSCWMPPRRGSRPSGYRVPVWRDVKGAVGGMPGALAGMVRGGRAMRAELAGSGR
jgi:carotenoid cleavage dioxygenase-like enzyme